MSMSDLSSPEPEAGRPRRKQLAGPASLAAP
jgi:hypothetical protein